ncbi:LamG domain-containing protein [Luteolibacter sp. Populi]|uniref:LamG domain-containing protein n=1 Tax=Luteolibacter sp. Populi TaxID=3230487 RepID=UPI003465C36A
MILDEDEDGMSDAWELDIISNSSHWADWTITNILPGDDFDGDGLSNLVEYQNGLSGHLTDSDGDGYGDRFSIDQELRLRLDESSGTVAADSSGKHRDGTLASSPAWQASGGIDGGALEFHGGADAVGLSAGILDGHGDLTISLWFKTASASAVQGLLSATGASPSTSQLAISLESGTTIRFHTGGGTSVTWTSGSNLADDQWHHAIVTRNTAAGQVALHLDGAPYGSPQAASLSALSVSALALGQFHQTVSTYDAAKAFTGHLDEIRIYSAVIGEGQLKDLFRPNDLDLDGLPDNYELSLFGDLAVLSSGADDLDGDGLSNRQEFEGGTDPDDYYNGSTPVISLVAGSGQTIYNRARTPNPLVFLVTRGGTPLVNAPVALSHLESLGGIETPDGEERATSLTLRTNSQGKVSVYFKAD